MLWKCCTQYARKLGKLRPQASVPQLPRSATYPSPLHSSYWQLEITYWILWVLKKEFGIWKIQQWPQDWKRWVFIPIPKKGNAKECSNYRTIVLISHASQVMLKIFQARLQQYVNWELPDVPAGFRKGKEMRDQIASICWIIGNAREFQKNIYFCFIDYVKAFDCVDHNKLWKILKQLGVDRKSVV